MPQAPDILIYFHYVIRDFYFPDRNRLKRFIPTIFSNESKVLERLDFIFCDDDYLLGINKQHLNHNYYTDIITFDLSTNAKSLVSEIYISVPRVKDNAEKLTVSFKEELHRVVFHGVLHLCGYKDKSQRATKAMRTREDFYLAKYFQ